MPSLNRRQFERDPLKCVAWVVEVDDDDQMLGSWQCETIDLSRSGLGLKSARMVHPGRRVAVEIMSGRGRRQTVLFGVVRQCRYEEGGGYMIGMEFERFRVSEALERYLAQWRSRAG